jgi:hypothetical protein
MDPVAVAVALFYAIVFSMWLMVAGLVMAAIGLVLQINRDLWLDEEE